MNSTLVESAPEALIPRLIDGDLGSGAWASDGTALPGARRHIVVAEDDVLTAQLGVLVRSEIVQGSLRPVPHVATALHVNETGELQIAANRDRAAEASRPVRVRIRDDTVRRIINRKTIAGDVYHVRAISSAAGAG